MHTVVCVIYALWSVPNNENCLQFITGVSSSMDPKNMRGGGYCIILDISYHHLKGKAFTFPILGSLYRKGSLM